MKLPNEVKEIIQSKFKRHHKDWFKMEVSSDNTYASFPMSISLGVPTQDRAINVQEKVRAWISQWQQWEKQEKIKGQIEWIERNWHLLGTQRIPERLAISTPEDAVSWLGKTEQWHRAVVRGKELQGRWPSLLDTLPKFYVFLADSKEADFRRLIEMLKWLCANPHSNLYPRQIPLSGIDSKWLESNKAIVTDFISAIHGKPADNYYSAGGLKPLPQLMRIRILDRKLRDQLGGLDDVSAPVKSIARIPISPKCVFIVENLQTGLAFGDLPDAVVIMGLGYGVDVLGQIPWLTDTRVIYWGDIDTHGFAILNRGRAYLPDMESILMDEHTLLEYRDLWVEEPKQSTSAELPLLSKSEQKLYIALKNNVYGQSVRLEQEQINWEFAMQVIEDAIGGG